jgi:hypothetical protein
MAKSLSELTSNSTSVQDVTPKPKSTTAKKVKKEPEFYIFRLVKENKPMNPGDRIFPPLVSITNQDTVLFNYGTEDAPDFRPRKIRYLDGFKSIFVDEQEENGVIDNTRNPEIKFQQGHLNVPSWNKCLIQFLKLNNQCEQQTNKLNQVNNLYRLLDFANNDESVVELGKKKDRAYDLARSATETDMIPHAKFLGIPFVHSSTGEEREIDAIREDYKAKALENPDKFLLYANNPKVKIRFIVEKALEQGVITTGLVRGQMHWTLSKQMICEIPINKDAVEAISDYACSEDGEAFYKTLKTQV